MANLFFSVFIIFMNVSFTGIKNLEIKTFKAGGYGFYLNNAHNIEQGDKYYTLVSLKADLDGTPLRGENIEAEGYKPHITQFLESLKKLRHFVVAQKILQGDNPGEIEIIMKHFKAPDNLGEVNQASFTLNGQEIPIVHRNVLPLYSCLGRITKDVLHFFNLKPETRESVQLMNDSIARNAVEFIENMNL